MPRLARECLKSLTAEDLKQIHMEHKEIMVDFESAYNDIQGKKLENELSKIVMRYNKEGKPLPKTIVQVEVKDNPSEGYFSSIKKPSQAIPSLPQSEIKG